MYMCEVSVTEKDGSEFLFKSVAEAARHYNMTETAVRNRLNGNVNAEFRKFKYTGRKIHTLSGKTSFDKDLPDEIKVYDIPYETYGTRICITQCQHRPQYKVGSVGCQACCKFRDIDRENHIVKCAHKGANERHYDRLEQNIEGMQ